MTEFIEIPGQAHVITQFLYTVRNYLTTELIDLVPESDPSRAVTIKMGRVLENPLQKNISVGIQAGDPEDMGFMDKRIDFDSEFKIGSLVATEIGGGCYWWRKGTVFFNTFFVRQRYEELRAYEYAYSFYGRLHKALDRMNFNPIDDLFGEKLFAPVYVESSRFTESGGADQFIWRGKLRWRVLSWKP